MRIIIIFNSPDDEYNASFYESTKIECGRGSIDIYVGGEEHELSFEDIQKILVKTKDSDIIDYLLPDEQAHLVGYYDEH